jgi:REP-associated tyrosine transposase
MDNHYHLMIKEAQKRYRRLVREGIQQGSPWNDLQGQILLGEEGFIDRFKDHLTDKEKIRRFRVRSDMLIVRPRLNTFSKVRNSAGETSIFIMLISNTGIL